MASIASKAGNCFNWSLVDPYSRRSLAHALARLSEAARQASLLQLISKWLQKASRYSGSKFHSGFSACSGSFPPDRGCNLILPNESIFLILPSPILASFGCAWESTTSQCRHLQCCGHRLHKWVATWGGVRCKHSPRSLLFSLSPLDSIMVYCEKRRALHPAEESSVKSESVSCADGHAK